LDWHFKTSKIYHFCTQVDMTVKKGSGFDQVFEFK
jgi:hypothetical protein